MATKLLIIHGRQAPSPAFQWSPLSSRHDSTLGPSFLQSSSAGFSDRTQIFPSLTSFPALRTSTQKKNKNPLRGFTIRSQFNAPLISPHDQWGNWTTLFAIGAFGLWYGTLSFSF